MTEILTNLWHSLLYFHAVAVLLSFFLTKSLNSVSLTALIVFVSETVLFKIDPKLKEFVTNNADIAIPVYYGTWMILESLIVFSIYWSHRYFRFSHTGFSTSLMFCYLGLMLLQLLGFVDDTYIRSDYLTKVYVYGVPTLTMCLVLLMFSSFYYKGRLRV